MSIEPGADNARAVATNAKRRPFNATSILGLLALASYAAHAAFHLAHGRWYDLFWACHVAAIFVGVGLLTRSATLNAIGVLIGLMGLPLWLADLAAGSELFPTSLLTHVVALGLGLYGVARFGMPRGAWWKAALVLLGLIGLCRLVTPADANVNVAFRVQSGWEDYFASHAGYLACTIGAATTFFFVVEWIARRLLAWRHGPQPANPR